MRRSSIAANPILIGAVTLLVVLVAVALSYNANRGLPFVPTYNFKVELPNAANLVAGNEVRIGATRVGVIDKVEAKRLKNGRTIAVASVKIEDRLRPLPKDTSQMVRFKSALGLKYIELTRGRSKQELKAGDTIPLSRAGTPVEFDEAFAWSDEKTRKATQEQLTGFADALAGRGDDLHAAIKGLGPLLDGLTPVMQNLSADDTGLSRLIDGLSNFSAEMAAIADENGQLVSNLDTTFTALASVAPQLREAIREGPGMQQAIIEELPRTRPFLDDTTRLLAELRPGIHALANNSGSLAEAVEAGGPALRRSMLVSRRLRPVMSELEATATDPMARLGVKDLGSLARIGRPLFEFLTPSQTVCNYGSLLLRNASSMVSVGDKVGTSQRFQLVVGADGPDSEAGFATAPANGGGKAPNVNFLHANNYPHTAAPGQEKECEAGNEKYIVGKQVVGNQPGNQGVATEKTKSTVFVRDGKGVKIAEKKR